MTITPPNASQVYQLHMREIIRTYVRELAGWDTEDAQRQLIKTLELIERAKDDPDLGAKLLAAEPRDLDDLINGSLLDLAEDHQVEP